MPDILFFSLAVLFSSFVTGMTGMGGGVLLLAALSPLVPAPVLIPLHGMVQLFSNGFRILISVRQVDAGIFLLFTAGAAAGALAGAPLVVNLSGHVLSLILAVSILVFTWLPRISGAGKSIGRFVAVGGVASFLSLFMGATGPLTAPFFLNSRLTRDSFVPTKAACQLPLHLFKVLVFFFGGFSIGRYLPLVALAVPLTAAGAWFGKFMTGKIPEARFKLLIRILITVLAVRMLVKVIS